MSRKCRVRMLCLTRTFELLYPPCFSKLVQCWKATSRTQGGEWNLTLFFSHCKSFRIGTICVLVLITNTVLGVQLALIHLLTLWKKFPVGCKLSCPWSSEILLKPSVCYTQQMAQKWQQESQKCMPACVPVNLHVIVVGFQMAVANLE